MELFYVDQVSSSTVRTNPQFDQSEVAWPNDIIVNDRLGATSTPYSPVRNLTGNIMAAKGIRVTTYGNPEEEKL
jgi:hypothetical protein